jgi:hypothetical protein
MVSLAFSKVAGKLIITKNHPSSGYLSIHFRRQEISARKFEHFTQNILNLVFQTGSTSKSSRATPQSAERSDMAEGTAASRCTWTALQRK